MAKSSSDPTDPNQLNDIPGPLFRLFELYDAETVGFRKVHRLIDAMEWAMKWHTVVAVSDVMRAAALTPELKVMFSSGLRSPTLGTWNMFYRESIQSLAAPSIPFQEWDRLLGLEKKHQLVNFRNKYGHGATPDDDQWLRDSKKYEPLLKKLVGSPTSRPHDAGLKLS